MDTDPIIMVVGMHSGGTSLVSGVLERLGVDMGETQVELNHDQARKYLVGECRVLGKALESIDPPPGTDGG